MFGTGSKSQRRAEMEMDLDIAVSSDKRRKNSHGSAPLSNVSSWRHNGIIPDIEMHIY